MRVKTTLVLTACLVLLPATGATGDNPLGRPIRVSEPDPLPTIEDADHCGSAGDRNPEQDPANEFNRSGWDTEATLVAEPGSPAHLVAAWTLNWNDALATATSTDGGRSWSEVVPPTTICTPGGNRLYDSSGFDPLLAFAPADEAHPRGVVYLLSTVSTGAGLPAAARTVVIANRSFDGGLSWSQPAELHAFEFPTQVETTGSVVADPACPERAYAVWAGGDVLAGERNLYFARTSDHGDSWSVPTPVPGLEFPREGQLVTIPRPGGCSALAMIAADIKPPPLEEVVATQTICGRGPTTLVDLRSDDGGLSWSPPVRFVQAHPTQMVGISVAAGPNAGLHVAWRYPYVDPVGRIRGRTMLVSSNPDTGAWGDPRTIDDQPAVERLGCNQVATAPGLAVNQANGIALTYYDQRRDGDPTDEVIATDYWLRRTRDGGVTWEDSHIAGPFNLATAPSSTDYPAEAGWFLGNYQGLVPYGTGFATAFVLAAPLKGANFELSPQLGEAWSHIPTDVYFARVP